MANDDENTGADKNDGDDTATVTRPTGKRKKSGGDGFDSVPDDFTPEADQSRVPGKVADSGKSGSAKSRRVAALGEKASQGKQVSFNLTPALLLKAVAALVALAVVVLLILGTVGYFHLRSQNDDRKASVNAGVNYAEQVTDVAHPDTFIQRVLPLTTGDLHTFMAKQNPQETVKQIQSLQLNTTTSVWSSSLESLDGNSGIVVVLLNISGTSVSASQTTNQMMPFRLHMEKHGSKWLVSSAENGPPPVGSGADQQTVTPGGTLPGSPTDTNAPQTPAPAPTN